jgi:hypothetical protein
MRRVVDPAADEARRQAWVDSLDTVTATLAAALGRTPAYVRDELVPVWEWFRPYCVPGPLSQDPDPRDPLEFLEGIPDWAANPARINERRTFGVETLRAIDVVARFHAEVLLRAHPGTRVAIFDFPQGQTDDDGDVVLLAAEGGGRGKAGVVFVHRDVVVQAQRATFHGGYAQDQLLKINDMRAARLAGA